MPVAVAPPAISAWPWPNVANARRSRSSKRSPISAACTRQGLRRRRVAVFERAQQRGDEQVAACGAIDAGGLDDVLGTSEPAPGLGHLTAEQQAQREPEATAGGVLGIPGREVGAMCVFPCGRNSRGRCR